MRPKKPANSPGPGPEVVERHRAVRERAAQKVRSWTIQNEMLSENSKKGKVRWGERYEKENRSVELVGDRNPGSEAPPRSKIERERKEQKRCL